jgi:AraC-like DNA-binding protein
MLRFSDLTTHEVRVVRIESKDGKIARVVRFRKEPDPRAFLRRRSTAADTISDMRSARLAFEGQGIRVAVVMCDEHDPRWSAEEPVTAAASVVLLRSGTLRRRVDGAEYVLDQTTAYVERPGSIQQVAHPAGGDVCTVIEASGQLSEVVAEAASNVVDDPLTLPADLDLDHRTLLARIRRGADRFEVAERATVLAGRMTAAIVGRIAGTHRSSNTRRAGEIRDHVRELLNDDVDLGLSDLADRIGISAFHLSRTFRVTTGFTLTHYRTHLRLARALERLEAGGPGLAALAAEVGFADQAHFTRAMRAHVGATPGQVRALIGTSGRRRTLPD